MSLASDRWPHGLAVALPLEAELYFADEAALNEALGSPAGAEAGQDFGKIAAARVVHDGVHHRRLTSPPRPGEPPFPQITRR